MKEIQVDRFGRQVTGSSGAASVDLRRSRRGY